MKHLSILILGLLLVASCSKHEVKPNGKLDKSPHRLTENYSQSAPGISQIFKVRIECIATPGAFVTPFAPGAWIVQKKNSTPIFISGMPDFGDGLEALAEDGMPGMLNNSLGNHPKVRSNDMFNTPVGAAGPAPIFPGEAYEFYITAKPKDYLNFATMFIQSNDLFVGPSENGIPLFDNSRNPIEGDVTGYLQLWDAGTEVNEEPGVGPNQAPRQSGPNTGPDENGVVQPVNDGFDYPAVSEVIKVTITPQ